MKTFIILADWEKINNEILNNKRAEYGAQIVQSLSEKPTAKYDRSFEARNLRRMILNRAGLDGVGSPLDAVC